MLQLNKCIYCLQRRANSERSGKELEAFVHSYRGKGRGTSRGRANSIALSALLALLFGTDCKVVVVASVFCFGFIVIVQYCQSFISSLLLILL